MFSIKNHKHRFITLIGFLLFGLFLVPSDSWAAGQLTTFFGLHTHYCDNIGTRYIASTVICEFLTIMDAILVSVFNGVQKSLLPVVQAVLTLYIVMFGVQLLMGTARVTPKDILGRLIKIAAVITFSTNINYSVGLAYGFYIGIITDAGQAIINAAFSGQSNSVFSPSTVSSCGLAFPTIGNTGDPSQSMPLFYFFDNLIYCAFVGAPGSASIKTIGFFMAMTALYPPLFGLFAFWAKTTFNGIAQLVLGFLTSLAAIAFLIALAPMFLSFMLFQTTAYLFENWLKYLAAYSIQIVISFGIVVLWIMTTLNFIYFFNDLSNLIYAYKPAQYAGNYLNSSDTWAICEASYWVDQNNHYHAACNACGSNASSCNLTNYFSNSANLSQLVPPSGIISHNNFIQYAFFHLVSLLMISYAYSQLLGMVHQIAGKIVGGSAVLIGFFEGNFDNPFDRAQSAPPPAPDPGAGPDKPKKQKRDAGKQFVQAATEAGTRRGSLRSVTSDQNPNQNQNPPPRPAEVPGQNQPPRPNPPPGPLPTPAPGTPTPPKPTPGVDGIS